MQQNSSKNTKHTHMIYCYLMHNSKTTQSGWVGGKTNVTKVPDSAGKWEERKQTEKTKKVYIRDTAMSAQCKNFFERRKHCSVGKSTRENMSIGQLNIFEQKWTFFEHFCDIVGTRSPVTVLFKFSSVSIFGDSREISLHVWRIFPKFSVWGPHKPSENG